MIASNTSIKISHDVNFRMMLNISNDISEVIIECLNFIFSEIQCWAIRPHKDIRSSIGRLNGKRHNTIICVMKR